MVNRKFLLVLLMFLITGCSRMEDSRVEPIPSTGRTIGALRSAAGLMSLMTRSQANLATFASVAGNPVNGVVSSLMQPSFSTSAKRVQELAQPDTKASPVLGIIAIGGHVINASGGIPPQNSFISLVIYENGAISNQIKIPLERSGIFRFDLVPWSPAYSYEVSTTFNNIDFYSGLIDGNGLQPGTIVEVPILVYDSSFNNRSLRALRMKVMYDFSTPGWVHVSENILISNPTSTVIVPAGDTIPVLNYVLPKDAVDITFPGDNTSNRYRLTEDGFGDWQPVMPGDGHQVMVQYSIPFTGTCYCKLNSPIPLDSLIIVVKGSGVETLGSGMRLNLVQSDPNAALAVYAASDIQSNKDYALNFSTRDQIQKIWLGVGFFVLSLAFALLWVIRSRRQKPDPIPPAGFAKTGENEDTILDAIIALDDRYKHEDISSSAYTRSRTELVEKLEAQRNQKYDPDGKAGQDLPG